MPSITPNEYTPRSWLKELRRRKRLTIRKIAPMLGISWQHYSDIEAGRRNPSIDLSMKMAEFFGIGIEKFLTNRASFKKETVE